MNRRSAGIARVATLAALSLLAVVAAVPAVTAGAGCAAQETSPAPDAAPAPCNRGPFIYCQPVAANVPGCNTEDDPSRWLLRLPRSTRYPVDCVINFVGERDEQGDCKLDAVCKCLVTTGPVTPADPDAGEAGVPSEPSVPRPLWNCYP